MDYNDLLAEILKMTPEQRKNKVCVSDSTLCIDLRCDVVQEVYEKDGEHYLLTL